MKIIIVGAGIVGRLIAVLAMRQGWQVTLLDALSQNAENTCSYAAAGLLSPFAELEQADIAILPLALQAINLWQKLLAEFSSSSLIHLNGSLWVAHKRETEDLLRLTKILKKKLQSSGYPADSYLKAIQSDAITSIEPALTEFSQGVFVPHEGYLLAQEVLTELGRQINSSGIDWHPMEEIQQITDYQAHSKRQTWSGDWIVDCRGMGAKNDWPALRGVRGELIWVNAPEVNLTHAIRFYHPRYALYIVPRPFSRYLIGASNVEGEDYSPISVQTTLELLSAAYSLDRGFAEARILKTVTHCRPTLPDHLPKIRRNAGVIRINGLYRHGYLLAPAVVNLALQVMAGEVIDANLQQYIEEG